MSEVVTSSAYPSAKGAALVSAGPESNAAEWQEKAVIDVRDHGIAPEVESDQATKINELLLAVPRGSTVYFPAANPEAGGAHLSRYFCSHAVEIPPDVTIKGPNSARVMFSALASFSGHQLVRNWKASDGTAFNAPNTTATPVYYPKLEGIGFDLHGQSNLTCLGLVHVQERAILRALTFFSSAGGGESGSGNVAVALFANNDTSGQCAGRWIADHWVGYGVGWEHWLYLDGTNGSTTTNWIRDIPITNITTPTGPADGTVCSDSPIYAKAVDGLYLEGHCETLPPAVSSDTAMVRLIDCSRAQIELRFSPGGYVLNRPAVRATQTGTAPAVYPMSSPHLHDCNLSVETNKGWTARTDSGCELTSGSTTVKDASVEANDRYRPVYGPGIPSGAFIESVVPGEKFTISAAPFITATVGLVIGSNVIEDEMGGRTRHFQWHATYFNPRFIYDYDGGRIDYVHGGGSTPERRVTQRQSMDSQRAGLAPASMVAETAAAGRFQGGNASQNVLTSGTLSLVPTFLFPGDVVSKEKWYSGATALAGGEHQWACLLGPERELLAISADREAEAWTASSGKEFAMVGAYTASLPAVHLLGLLVKAATVPSLQAYANPLIGSAAPVLNGTSSAGLTTPTSCPAIPAAPSFVNGIPYVLVT